MDLGNVMAMGSVESEQLDVQNDPATATGTASVNVNPTAQVSKPKQPQHLITSYTKTTLPGSHLAQLNTVTSNTAAGFSLVSPSGGSAKAIVVVPVSAASSNPASGDASQPVLKKVKLTTNQ